MSGKIVLTIKTDPATGVRRGYDNLGNYVGKYDPKTKLTYSKGGKEVSKGDGLVGVATNCLCPKGMGAICHPVGDARAKARRSGRGWRDRARGWIDDGPARAKHAGPV